MKLATQNCPLCMTTAGSAFFDSDKNRDYFRCGNCHLIHVPPTYFLSREEEKNEYDKHRNLPEDGGYRSFLNRLYTPLCKRLSPNSHGLDFGCGPGPTLSLMFEEAGHRMNNYDPIYAHSAESLDHQYDFITASEVVEHLHDPAKELERLWALLKPGGWLGVMTKLALDREAFSRWHYKNDMTHVCFFSKQTMEWLAKRWGARYFQVDKDVALFQKASQ